jgi:sulfur carrier protein
LKQNVINLIINGLPQTLPATMSVAQLVEKLGYTGKRIALERNGEIVPRSTYENVQLADGDILEVVVAVGGG